MFDNQNFSVCVRCMTYNHSAYIEDALGGFAMQQTDFPYVCVVVDDASTDGEPDIIKKYVDEHFVSYDEAKVIKEDTQDYNYIFTQHKTNKNCFFAVYYLKYNHWGKKDKAPYYEKYIKNSKYIAICEGDDYWVDPLKLQKQVDYMEMHPECTMTCCRSYLFSHKQRKIIGEQYCLSKDGELNPIDVINRTGLYIPTCSILYNRSALNHYPNYCVKCAVGDYPLQIYCAMVGMIYYFDKSMVVYRIDNPNSWMGKQDWCSLNPQRLKVVQSQIEMFKGFLLEFPSYLDIFKSKIAQHINSNIPSWRFSRDDVSKYKDYFKNEIAGYGFWWKCDLFIMSIRIPFVRGIYSIIFKKKYEVLQVRYLHKRKEAA